MSIKLMTVAWDKSPYTGTKLIMHLALCDHANPEGICWPGAKSLAKKCRIKERQARNLLAEIIADGLLEVIEHGGGTRPNGEGIPNRYRVHPVAGYYSNDTLQESASTLQSEQGYPATAIAQEPSLKHHKTEEDNDPVRYWANLTAMAINGEIVQAIEDLEADWQEREKVLPEAHPDKGKLPGEVVIAAMKVAALADARSINYVRRVMESWIRDGVGSKKNGNGKRAKQETAEERLAGRLERLGNGNP